MKAVITGDIVNSRSVSPDIWLTSLKKALNKIGPEYSTWEVFRGDSIQLIIAPEEALKIALLLKSVIKQIPFLDIRLAIGIGSISYTADKITASNGAAFINSGEAFDELKKHTLVVNTPWKEFNSLINIMLDLAVLIIDTWRPTTSEVVHACLENPTWKQIEIAALLNKKQGNVSYSLKKAGYDEILKCVAFYKSEIKKLCY